MKRSKLRKQVEEVVSSTKPMKAVAMVELTEKPGEALRNELQ